jgi:hypothetical protein
VETIMKLTTESGEPGRTGDSIEQLGAAIVADHKKGADHLKAAGEKLVEAKRRIDVGEARDLNWPNFLRRHCKGMSEGWASQLMAVARGDVSVEELRAKARKRQRLCRERKKRAEKASSASGEVNPTDTAAADPGKAELTVTRSPPIAPSADASARTLSERGPRR